MLGVDRLDMIKGIPQKLLAYEKFLEEHPEWRDKVLLVQIAVPSRTDVPEYQKLRSMVHEIVGRINGQFGTLTYVPIHHLDRSLSFTGKSGSSSGGATGAMHIGLVLVCHPATDALHLALSQSPPQSINRSQNNAALGRPQ